MARLLKDVVTTSLIGGAAGLILWALVWVAALRGEFA